MGASKARVSGAPLMFTADVMRETIFRSQIPAKYQSPNRGLATSNWQHVRTSAPSRLTGRISAFWGDDDSLRAITPTAQNPAARATEQGYHIGAKWPVNQAELGVRLKNGRLPQIGRAPC